MEINFVYAPILLIPGAILLALGIYFFYFRSSAYKGRRRWTLAGLRFISLFAILFFLLQPFILQRENYSIKPRLIWLEDQSNSMHFHNDSMRLDSVLINLQKSRSGLDDKFQQTWLSFGADLGESPEAINSKYSNLHHALYKSSDQFYGEDIAAIVLISDGIYNQGRNPAQFENRGDSLPIYSLMHGNTSQLRDLSIADLRYNSKISQGRSLSLEIDIAAVNALGEDVDLKLLDAQGKSVALRRFRVNRKNWFESIILEIPCNDLGFQKYKLVAAGSRADANPQNNERSIGFEVIDEAFKVLLYSPKTHPDVGAIRQALNTAQNWEIEYVSNREDIELEEVKSIIAFDWDLDLLDEIRIKKVPSLFIASAESPIDLLGFNGLSREEEQQFGRINSNLGLFKLSEEDREEINTWPPIRGVYGSINLPTWAEALLYKRIGAIDLSEAIAFSGEQDGLRTGLFIGDGFWRWRLYNYKHRENTDAFDNFFRSWVDYLQSQEREEQLVLEFENQIYAEESSKVLAKLYDPSGAMVNQPDIDLRLSSEEGGAQYDFKFSREANFYRLKLDGLPAGFYQYQAKSQLGSKQYQVSGRIWVRANALEQQDLQARRDLLQYLSVKSGGKSYELNDWSNLLNDLEDLEAPRQLVERKNKRELISKWWLFFVVLTGLSLEWFLRKFWGHY